MRIAPSLGLSLALICGPSLSAQARRVVDVLRAGDAVSAWEHSTTGDGTLARSPKDLPFRKGCTHLGCTLVVYDDSEVTLQVDLGPDRGGSLELLVEGQKLLSQPAPLPERLEVRIPLSLSLGRTSLHVTLRASLRGGVDLRELRTIQEHLE